MAPIVSALDKVDMEMSLERLSAMKEEEARRAKDMYTIVLSDGTRFSTTNIEALSQYEIKRRKDGVIVKERFYNGTKIECKNKKTRT